MTSHFVSMSVQIKWYSWWLSWRQRSPYKRQGDDSYEISPSLLISTPTLIIILVMLHFIIVVWLSAITDWMLILPDSVWLYIVICTAAVSAYSSVDFMFQSHTFLSLSFAPQYLNKDTLGLSNWKICQCFQSDYSSTFNLMWRTFEEFLFLKHKS